MGYMLETRGLTKRFGRGDQAQDAVADVSLHIREGEVYGLLGPNGAGKSTTLKMICGMLRPTAGEILFAGHAWRREDLYAIGSLIEEAPLYPNLTARENLRVRTTLLGLPESRVDEVLAAVDLADTGKKRAGRFSMGMRQRLGLALALIARPRLLVLDEPTNDLDIVTLNVLEDYLRNFKGCVIVVSHDRYFMDKVVDHLLVFKGNGELKDFPGNYTDYREWREAQEQKARNEQAERGRQESKKAAPEKRTPAENGKRRLSFKEKKELEQLETEIAALEEEKKSIETALCSGTLGVDELTEKSKRLPEVNDLLDEKTLRWLELSEIEG